MLSLYRSLSLSLLAFYKVLFGEETCSGWEQICHHREVKIGNTTQTAEDNEDNAPMNDKIVGFEAPNRVLG